jgi:1,4-alpha-glucan branching enzyme
MTEIVTNRERFQTDWAAVDAIVRGEASDPFAVLGAHPFESDGRKYTAVRAFRPQMRDAILKSDGATYPMERVNDAGFFEVFIAEPPTNFSYTIVYTDYAENTFELADAYGFPPLLSDYELYLGSQGNYYKSYEKFGAHLKTVNGTTGVMFVLWAPSARRVSVVGDFNGWDGRVNPMRKHPDAGLWEIFIPGLGEGTIYKYEIKSLHNNYMVEKADPYGFFSEMRPRTASVVADLDSYEWQDSEWINTGRAKHNKVQAPMSIYELHLGSWRRRWDAADHDSSYMSYREMAQQLVDYIRGAGYTHIELLPISEHPFDGSWGYQTIGYYAVTSRFGPPQDFMYLVDLCHQNNIGVLVDWVPAHFPKDSHGLGYFDGTHLYEHADPRQGEHADWGTFVFNYGRNEVRQFLISNALFWLDKYHIDGLRVDAVASMLYLDYSRQPGEWVPNMYGGRENLEAIDFIRKMNEVVHGEFPHTLTCAEESTAWPMVTKPTYLGGLGFDLKWNMGWMHDILEYMETDPIYRRFHHKNLTFSMVYAFSENYILPFSHDEVVHLKKSMLDKMPGDEWQKFASLRALYGYMYAHPGKKLLFMGSEFGQWKEWNERTALQWELLDSPAHGGLLRFSSDLNRMYQREKALYEVDDAWEGFKWLNLHDSDNSTLGFLRAAKDPSDAIVVLCNFTPVPRHDYRIGVPIHGYYAEVLNSDSGTYWGSNMGNMGGVHSDEWAWGEYDYSISLTLPPLSAVYLRVPQPSPTAADVVADK